MLSSIDKSGVTEATPLKKVDFSDNVAVTKKTYEDGILTKFDQDAIIEEVLAKYEYSDADKKKWRERK